MRYMLAIAALSGLLVGAALPIGVGLGDPQCSETSNTHFSGLTSCGADYEDHTVDTIGNTGAYGWVCIQLEPAGTPNIDATIFWNQCNQIDTDETFDATIEVRRTDCHNESNWYTDTWVSGAGSSNCGKEHQHYTNYFDPCADPC